MNDTIMLYQRVVNGSPQSLENAALQFQTALLAYVNKPTPIRAATSLKCLLRLMKLRKVDLSHYIGYQHAPMAPLNEDALLDKVVRAVNTSWFIVRGPVTRVNTSAYGPQALSLLFTILVGTGQNMDIIWHKIYEQIFRECKGTQWVSV